jgi:hypothetical protein
VHQLLALVAVIVGLVGQRLRLAGHKPVGAGKSSECARRHRFGVVGGGGAVLGASKQRFEFAGRPRVVQAAWRYSLMSPPQVGVVGSLGRFGTRRLHCCLVHVVVGRGWGRWLRNTSSNARMNWPALSRIRNRRFGCGAS